jgi:two-component system, chemotaxis family, CheB/CheR fusion protein
VKSEIREPIVFAEQNLLRDPPFSNLDLLVCRNLLIYLTAPGSEQAAAAVSLYLEKTGGLVFGHLGKRRPLSRVVPAPEQIIQHLSEERELRPAAS